MVKNLFGARQRKTGAIAAVAESDLPRPGIAAQIVGIENIALLNASLDDGVLHLEEDSQIIFSLDGTLASSNLLVRIELRLESCDAEATPKLYLDYGMDFSEELGSFMKPLHLDDADAWAGFVPLPHMLRRLRLDITEESGRARIGLLKARPIDLASIIAPFEGLGFQYLRILAARKAAESVRYLESHKDRASSDDGALTSALLAGAVAHGFYRHIPESDFGDEKYLSWIVRNEKLDGPDLEWMKAQAEGWERRPRFSVVMPVFDPPLDLLDEAISSLAAQTYEDWELCIADDASRNPGVRKLLDAWSERDRRVKVVYRTVNGHIAEASNSAAALATGDFLVLMDNDDRMPPHALWTVAYYIDRNPGCAMLFSDEDKISINGFRFNPYNKGRFDRLLMYGHNMFSHLGVYKRSLFAEIGGFRKGYEGSQDYDLTLRGMEACGEERIVHIPHVLYHWRQIPGSTSMGAGQKSYAFEAAKRVLNEHYQRCGYPLEAVDSEVPGIAAIRTLSTGDPATVSVVIPTRDNLDVLQACIDSLQFYADPLMEVVIVDNGSKRRETFAYFDRLTRDGRRFKVVRSEAPFNFSQLCNVGVAQASGGIVCLLNNDTEVIAPGFFERARAWLSIPDVGVVGARLLYPDRTLQHFGVCTGVGPHGIAEHCYLGLPDGHHANFSKSRLAQQFNVVTGACLFMRRADYLRLGGLDETLPVAYNDVDLCLRVREAGAKVICDPAIRLIHKESTSRGRDVTSERKARLQRDAEAILEKWGDDGLVDPFYSPNFATTHATFEMSLKPASSLPWKSPKRA